MAIVAVFVAVIGCFRHAFCGRKALAFACTSATENKRKTGR
jgi:hypothetical protein